MADKKRWPKDVENIIETLWDVELSLSDGYGYYLAQWDQDFDKRFIRIARRLKRAALKDAENDNG